MQFRLITQYPEKGKHVTGTLQICNNETAEFVTIEGERLAETLTDVNILFASSKQIILEGWQRKENGTYIRQEWLLTDA